MVTRRKVPRPCLGYGDTPCPHHALVPSKHCHRCKSCAAKQRLLDRGRESMLASMEAAWAATRLPSAEPTGATVRFDRERVVRYLDGIPVDSAEEILGWTRTTLTQYLNRGTMPYYRLDELACWLGTHPDSLAVSA